MGRVWSAEQKKIKDVEFDCSNTFLYTGDNVYRPPPRNVISVCVAASVREIPYATFERCEALEKIEFERESNLETIGEFAFSKCASLTTISLPPSVRSIQKGAFHCCLNLLSVELSKGLVAIGDQAFQDCFPLRSLSIPSTVAVLGERVFSDLKLQQHIPSDDPDSHIVSVLKSRFDALPLHELCYYHACYDDAVHRLRDMIKQRVDDDGEGEKQDLSGMTPLHLLALSAKCNIPLLSVLLERYPKALLVKDKWGNVPLVNAIRTNKPIEMVSLLLATQQQIFPDVKVYWKGLLTTASNLRSSDLTKYLVRCSIATRLDAITLLAWRLDIEEYIDAIPDLTSNASFPSSRNKKGPTGSRQTRQAQIKAIEDRLALCEWKENLSLLEMALWQAKLNETEGRNDPDHRRSCRVQSGDQVVISNVLPYLGKYNEPYPKKKVKSISLLPTPSPWSVVPALRHL